MDYTVSDTKEEIVEYLLIPIEFVLYVGAILFIATVFTIIFLIITGRLYGSRKKDQD